MDWRTWMGYVVEDYSLDNIPLDGDWRDAVKCALAVGALPAGIPQPQFYADWRQWAQLAMNSLY